MSQAGGYIWIQDNRFAVELENLDPYRRRIKLQASDPTLIAGPATVRGNQFFGPAAPVTITVSGSTATVTLDQAKHGVHRRGRAPEVDMKLENARYEAKLNSALEK
jgi:hypothetical protein